MTRRTLSSMCFAVSLLHCSFSVMSAPIQYVGQTMMERYGEKLDCLNENVEAKENVMSVLTDHSEQPAADKHDANENKNLASKVQKSGCRSDGAEIHQGSGTGLYRDPLEILGPRFGPSVTKELCSATMLVDADVVRNFRFTIAGQGLCRDVCAKYRDTMILNGLVDVKPMSAYCDYTGTVAAINNDSDLSSECVCGYKVRCNYRASLVTYSFRPNPQGYLRVSASMFGKKTCIT